MRQSLAVRSNGQRTQSVSPEQRGSPQMGQSVGPIRRLGRSMVAVGLPIVFGVGGVLAATDSGPRQHAKGEHALQDDKPATAKSSNQSPSPH